MAEVGRWTDERGYEAHPRGCAATSAGEVRQILERQSAEQGVGVDTSYLEVPQQSTLYVCGFTVPEFDDLFGAITVPGSEEAGELLNVGFGGTWHEIYAAVAEL